MKLSCFHKSRKSCMYRVKGLNFPSLYTIEFRFQFFKDEQVPFPTKDLSQSTEDLREDPIVIKFTQKGKIP